MDPNEEDVEMLPHELLNDENKILSDKVRAEQARHRKFKRRMEEQNDRIQVLEDHLKKVKNEIYYTQVLVTAKEKEIETENHFRMMAEREIGRYYAELKQMEGEAAKVQDSIDNVKNEIFKGNEKLDKFKLQMNFNQEELEQWILAEKQKEDDLIAIEKYRRKDDQKISEVTLEIEKLQRKLDRLRHVFQEEVTSTQSSQIELDKTAEDFRIAHAERNDLVEKYEEATKVMKKREDEIEETTRNFNDGKEVVHEVQEEIITLRTDLEKHKSNTRETQNLTMKVSRNNEKLKMDLEEKKNRMTQVGDEIDVVRNTLSKASNDLHTLGEKVKLLTKRKALEKRKLNRGIRDLEKRSEALSQEEVKKMKSEEVNKRMETKLEEVTKKRNALVKILRDLKDVHYKKSEELYIVKQDETNLKAEISGTKAQIKNLQAKIVQMDQKAYKQQELVYNIGYSIQQMERKVNRAQGQRTQEQTEKLKKTIKTLNEQLEGTEKKNSVLNSEWKKAQGEVRKYALQVKTGEGEREKLKEVVHELALQNSSHEKEIEAQSRQRDEMMVAHDVLKLQLKRLSDVYHERTKEVSGLENRKLQLELTLQEKVHKLEAVKKILINDFKAAKEVKRGIILDLNLRKSKVEKLKNKFSIMIRRIKTDDDTGEEMTQAGFLIRAIQEREELQRTGDGLDQQIQKLEAQMDGIDRTLELFKRHNIMHLSSQKRPRGDDQTFGEKRQLDEEINRVESIIGQKIQEKNVHRDNLQDVHGMFEQLRERFAAINYEVGEVEGQTEQLRKEKEDLDGKWQQKKKAKNQYFQRAENKGKLQCFEQNIRNENTVFLMRLLCSDDPTMAATLERLLEEYDIQSRHVREGRPGSSRPSTASSSRPPSNRSTPRGTPRGSGNGEKENQRRRVSKKKKKPSSRPSTGGQKKKKKKTRTSRPGSSQSGRRRKVKKATGSSSRRTTPSTTPRGGRRV